MRIEDLMKKTTEEFIQLWNKWDLDAAMKYFKDDIVFYSENVSKIYPENTEGKLVGRENVRLYWIELKRQIGELKFELEDFKKVDNQIFTISRIIGQDKKLHSFFTYNEYGRLTELRFEYK